MLDEVEQWFDAVSTNFERALDSWSRTAPSRDVLRRPFVDLRDSGEEFVATAELPGVTKDDVEVTVTPNSLELRAKAACETDEDRLNFVVRERTYSEMLRTVPLPSAVEPEKATATLRDGVLEVHLPKNVPAPALKPLKVSVG